MRLAVVALLAASPAVAQEVTFTEDESGIVAHYHNELTMWDAISEQVYRFDSSRGPVVFKLTRTQNNSCEPMPCADRLEVVETPPGTVAIPAEVELPELAKTTVRVVEFQGI